MKQLILLILVAVFTLLTACSYSSEKVVDEYDISQLNVNFGDHEAYEIGANAKGMPIFKDHKQALQQAIIDYQKGFEATAEQYELEPVTTQYYHDYMTYAWQLDTTDEDARQQGMMITKFFDIYENSFK